MLVRSCGLMQAQGLCLAGSPLVPLSTAGFAAGAWRLACLCRCSPATVGTTAGPRLRLCLAALPARFCPRSLAWRGFGLGAGFLALPACRPRAGSLPHPPAGLCPLLWGGSPAFGARGRRLAAVTRRRPVLPLAPRPPVSSFPPCLFYLFFGGHQAHSLCSC